MAENTTRISFNVTPEFHKQVKVYAALSGMKLKEYIIYAIKKDMNKKGNQ